MQGAKPGETEFPMVPNMHPPRSRPEPISSLYLGHEANSSSCPKAVVGHLIMELFGQCGTCRPS